MEYNITKNGTIAEVALKDELTFSDHEQFRTILTTLAADTGISGVVIDVRGISFIDSAGIGMLIIANDEAKERRQELTIRGARDQVKAALDIADLKALVRVTD